MIRIVILTCLVPYISGVIVHLNESEYARMPTLVHLDSFEECQKNPEALYCFARLELVSDTTSPLLKMIKDYSAHYKTHFNHTKLRRGVCLTDTCKYVFDAIKDPKLTIEACFNDTLEKSHGLKAKVMDENFFCYPQKMELQTGVWDILFTTVMITLLLANILGSVYYYYYGAERRSAVSRFLLCFSMQRNWKKFRTIADHTDRRLSRLQSLHGMRSVMTFLVIGAHANMPCAFEVPENPQFVEKMYDHWSNQIWFNGSMIMQSYLIISGFLLVFKSLMLEESIKLTWHAAPKLLFLRWLRVTPYYLIHLGFVASWMQYMTLGPLWKILVGYDTDGCRKYWWHNILYINNYFDTNDCMSHTWYLAADMQLYCVGILVVVLCKSPRVRNRILILLFLTGLIIPALHTYFQNFEAVFISYPEASTTRYVHDRYFNVLYKRGHNNLAGYTIGLALGYLVYHWQKIGVNGRDYHKYRYVYRSLWLIATGLVYISSVFYEHRPDDPMYVRVLFAIFHKPLFGIMVAGTIAGTILKVEDFYSGILEWKPWTYLSRLSYGSYFCHVAYTRLYGASLHTTQHLSYELLHRNFAMNLTGTFLTALLFWVTIEAPITNVIDMLVKKPLKKSDKEVNGLTRDDNQDLIRKNKNE